MERIFNENTVSCGGCPSHENKEKQSVPRIAHEADMARMERTVHRLWISNIVMIVLLFVACAGFAYYESQFEDAETTITQDLDSGYGGDAIINDGVHINGKSEADGHN